ncbi:MAG: flagellar basal-body rod protein FlgF [Pseudomonadales bacterium]|uniref:Flagellar basal-body rod protein FlgF n=1 Tax=Oleiphilus messinensis TaxID=141451 RepID=A0A1Y0ICJ8_9GAMM|nr:flagellar basal-body rod protein FlgF [Oleiphilus messinensis]ARU57103.1 flagellar basal body rod protein FlgF [Oleiphilus messinensis]MCG8611003.1 flagellar basal-body rod protein FlgF [Pseudomonadales bacterium]
MDKALYISMSGAKQNMLSQQAHANNLANANTVGFKRDLEQARSMPVFGDHFPTRAYAMSERPATDTQMGPMIETGRSLDVAVRGDGWIAVQAEDGQPAYTRDGQFNIDANGILRTAHGLAVLGNGGPIVVPPADKVEIGGDGTISIIPAGQGAETIAEIDRIQMVKPDNKTMEKGLDGLMRPKPGVDQPVPDATVTLESGFLEGSNVNVVDALTQVMSLSRQYELQVKVMRSADENSQAAARLLQNS